MRRLIELVLVIESLSLVTACRNQTVFDVTSQATTRGIQSQTPEPENVASSSTQSSTPSPTANKITESIGNPGQQLSLESWLGDYTFAEFAPPDINMFYNISIYKEYDAYRARVSIVGFQTLTRIQANVQGDGSSIAFVFEKYLPQNMYDSYKPGDDLLSFEKKGSQLYTTWGKINAILKENQKPGNYFELKDNASVKVSTKATSQNESLEDKAVRMVAEDLGAKYNKDTNDYSIPTDSYNVLLMPYGFNKSGEYEVRVCPSYYPLSVFYYYYVDLKKGTLRREGLEKSPSSSKSQNSNKPDSEQPKQIPPPSQSPKQTL